MQVSNRLKLSVSYKAWKVLTLNVLFELYGDVETHLEAGRVGHFRAMSQSVVALAP